MAYSDDGAKVQCHACGRFFGALNTHLKTHGLDGDSYKERYGLARGASLLPPATQERYRAAAVARDQGEIGRQHLPPPTPRAKGIKVRLSSRLDASEQRKGRRRG
jgi:predicted transcriptional regulator